MIRPSLSSLYWFSDEYNGGVDPLHFAHMNGRFVIRLRYLVFLACWGMLAPVSLLAQFPNNNTNSGGGLGGFGGGANLPGSVNGFANPGLADSSLLDSSRGELPKIKPNTRYIDRKNVFRQQPARYLLLNRVDNAYMWDELDFARGYTRHLGQLGKPHQVLRMGFDERFQANPQWRDPITGQVNHYIINPESQVLYLDTRTPFVEVDYLQGPDRLQRTDVTVSQNVTARLNFTVDFERRLAEGVYRTNTTDETVTYLSSSYRTRDGRLESFANVHYSNLSNQMNGGTPRPESDDYAVVDGIIQENPALFPNFFFKGGSAPVLSQASRKQTVLGAYTDNYYHLFRGNDTTNRANQLTIRQTAAFTQHKLRFIDTNVPLATLANNLIPVYPTLAPDSTDLFENYTGRSYHIGGEINYRLEPRLGYRLWLQGGLTYRRNALIKDGNILVGQNMTEQRAAGTLELPFFEAKASLYQGISDAFSPARNLTLEASLLPIGKQTGFRVRDTLAPDSSAVSLPDRKGRYRFRAGDRDRAPIKLFGSYSVQAVNPTLFQAYFVGDSGNAYTPNPDLVNQGMTFLKVGARWQGATPVRMRDTLQSSYAELGLFLSQSSRFIYYDQALNPLQAIEGATLRWVGTTFKSRTRLPLKLYLETDVSAQIGTANGDAGLERYAQYLPQVYGKGLLYYESSRVSFAEKARIGIEARGQTSFVGQTVDPVSGEFLPTDYQVPAYIQLNAFASLRIRGVFVYVRYIHANEGFFAPGYYTTPFYPMQEASLTLGVIWQFFN
ncbi:MAG: putative porin [Bacteroidota bacterium]